jgi:hypothetical protein
MMTEGTEQRFVRSVVELYSVIRRVVEILRIKNNRNKWHKHVKRTGGEGIYSNFRLMFQLGKGL